jgi:dihydrofolate reductase
MHELRPDRERGGDVIALVATLDAAGIIGVGGHLPWHIPAARAHVRALTMGKVVVMGRKTWESLSGPLEGRVNAVMTRRGTTMVGAAYTVADLPKALRYFAGRGVYVIGGGEVFAQTIWRATHLYLTRIHHTLPAGDGAVYFPAFDGFTRTAAVERAVDAENPWPMTFETWERTR